MAVKTPAPMTTRIVLLAVVALFTLLQGRLWLSDDGWSEVVKLRLSVADQEAENSERVQRNARLLAEVSDLKNGFEALEERARADLGMIGRRESFFVWASEPTSRSGSGPSSNPSSD